MTSQSNSNSNQVDLGRLTWVGLAAIVLSVVANIVARVILFAVLELPAGFPPLQVGAITFFTVVGTLGAVIVYAIVRRRAAQPIRTFRIIAVVALIISVIPNVALAVDPSAAPFPGGTPLAFLALIVFHVVAAGVSVGLLTTQAVE